MDYLNHLRHFSVIAITLYSLTLSLSCLDMTKLYYVEFLFPLPALLVGTAQVFIFAFGCDGPTYLVCASLPNSHV